MKEEHGMDSSLSGLLDMTKEKFFEMVDENGRLITQTERLLIIYQQEKIKEIQKQKEDREMERNLLLKSVSTVNNTTNSFSRPTIPASSIASSSSTIMETSPSLVPSLVPSSTEVDQSLNKEKDEDKMVEFVKPVSTLKDRDRSDLNNETKNIKSVFLKEKIEENLKDVNAIKTTKKDIIEDKIESVVNESHDDNPTKSSTSRIKRKFTGEDDEDDGESNYIPVILSDIFDSLGFNILHSTSWRAIQSTKYLELPLEDFGFSDTSCNVLAIKLSIPHESPRWALNICPRQHLEQQNVLLHFNPRYKKKSELIFNDKIGTWGKADKHFKNISNFNREIVIVVIIRPEGFYVFSDSTNLIGSFVHRRDISSMRSLCLTAPTFDDNGNPEDVMITKVWWGMQKSLRNEYNIPAVIATRNKKTYEDHMTNSIIMGATARTVQIGGLPKHKDGTEIMELEAAIYGVFDSYSPEAINLVVGLEKAYIRFKTVEDMEDALMSKNNITMGTSEADKFTLKLTALSQVLE